jgi:hypothetical protein
VLVPRLILRLEGGQWWYLVPLVLCVLLLAKLKRSWSPAGNIPLAFLFGVGAALAVGGGLVGTLLPQVQASFVSLNPAHYRGLAAQEGGIALIYVTNAILVTLGTVCSLLYFYFTSRENASSASAGGRFLNGVIQVARGFGRVFIMFTFGALLATTSISYISVLVDRIRFLIETLWSWLQLS